MNKLICFVGALLFCHQTDAQNINFHLTSDSIVFSGQINFPFASAATLENNNTTQVVIRAIRIVNHVPPIPAWQSSMCANICYGTSVDTIQFSIDPGSSQTFEVLFQYATHNIDTAHVKVHLQCITLGILFDRDQNFYGMDSLALASVNPVLSSQKSLLVFPNPVNDRVHISTDVFNDKDNLIICIFDVTGKKVKQTEITGSSAEYYFDVSELNSGWYMICIEKGETVITSKFILQ